MLATVGLVAALAARGCVVTYVAERRMSASRMQQGWTAPEMPGVRVALVDDGRLVRNLVHSAHQDSVHLCQGLRANGRVGISQRTLAQCGLRQWALMETVNDSGWTGGLKRMEYRRLISFSQSRLDGILAIGHNTSNWLACRGLKDRKVFPFAYFIADRAIPDQRPQSVPFRYIFVGQVKERERLSMLIKCLASIELHPFELVVIGSGRLENRLQKMAKDLLPGRHRWIGRLPSSDISIELASADVLVLPSRHDGWGAVVSEALMVGTPAICSDACGAAGVVRLSAAGGVFPSGNGDALREELLRCLASSKVSSRQRIDLASWATALGAGAGARYLLNILAHIDGSGDYPRPPWEEKQRRQ